PTMRVKGRWHVTSKLLVLIGATVLASSQLIGTSARAADPIKVGWVGPLSPPGGYAEGALMKQAAEIAADELNAKGGVLGRPIQVIFVDTRGKPEEGTAAAERLISQEKVVAITGEFHSSVFLAEMEVAHKAGIPIIAVDVWALKITAKGYPEVFRVAPNQALIAAKYGDWMAARRSIRRSGRTSARPANTCSRRSSACPRTRGTTRPRRSWRPSRRSTTRPRRRRRSRTTTRCWCLPTRSSARNQPTARRSSPR